MKNGFWIPALICFAVAAAPAKVASHTSTLNGGPAPKTAAVTPTMQVTGKAVARVNGAVLTDRDLLRQMFAIFPYAQQHNGFPRGMEAEIRQGALQMIIFEELVYQEARRQKLSIPASQLDRAEAGFRKQ